MKVSNVLENEVLQIKVEGRIDSSTHLQLREELEKMEFARAKEVIMDFKDVEYISSAGLRELLIIRKRTVESHNLSCLNDRSLLLSQELNALGGRVGTLIVLTGK